MRKFIKKNKIISIFGFISILITVSYKPECENSKKAYMTLKPLFLELIQFIEITIACCVIVDEL